MKKVYIVSSSLRGGSNSEVLASEFARGVKDNGGQVEFLSLKDFDLKFCIGCLACQATGRCVLQDDMEGILDDISDSDVLVFATPVYYYEMSGQLKTFLDRLNPLYGRDNKFSQVYMLGTCADSDPRSMDRAISGLEGWIECFDGVSLAGTLLATSTDDPNSIDGKFLDIAYEMGKSVE